MAEPPTPIEEIQIGARHIAPAAKREKNLVVPLRWKKPSMEPVPVYAT
jgi:hypothetical protein